MLWCVFEIEIIVHIPEQNIYKSAAYDNMYLKNIFDALNINYYLLTILMDCSVLCVF